MGLETLIPAGLSLLGNIFGASVGANAASGAANTASAAQQAAITQALARAQTGYDANQATIKTGDANSTGYLNQGFQGATSALSPLINRGDRASTYIANATGVNGEDARNAYMQQLQARPEYQAANNYAAQGVMQQNGAQQNSGALARAMQTRQTQFAQQYANNDINNVEPLARAGDQASGLQAANAQAYGNNQAQNTWKTANAFTGNENNLTTEYMNGAISRGNVSANNAITNGQIDQNLYSSIGNAFGRTFGGNNNNNNNNNNNRNGSNNGAYSLFSS